MLLDVIDKLITSIKTELLWRNLGITDAEQKIGTFMALVEAEEYRDYAYALAETMIAGVIAKLIEEAFDIAHDILYDIVVEPRKEYSLLHYVLKHRKIFQKVKPVIIPHSPPILFIYQPTSWNYKARFPLKR